MMMTNGQKSLSAIGFLTIIQDDEHGLFGGYLLLNPLGRPLEFHCTAPVKPNRAQEILYGPTLESYLYGERIGPALLEKAKSGPNVVFTDVSQVMAARPFTSRPLMLILPESHHALDPGSTDHPADRPFNGAPTRRLDPASGGTRSALPAPAALHRFRMGDYWLAVDTQHAQDQSVMTACWSQLDGQVDLREPFGRIRDAIDEARRGVSG